MPMTREQFNEAFRDYADDERVNGSGPSPRFKFKPFEEIKVGDGPAFIVQDIIPRDGLVVIWGPPKCGKSFLAFDMAMHIALGWTYREHHVEQGTVVYLALEGGSGFARRVEAWRRRHLDGHHGPVPFYLLDVPVNVIADHKALIVAIGAQIATPPSTIFIDTLNRGLVGDENNPKDMAAFIRAADAIRAAFPGCTVVLIHHCGHVGSRPRGHTSLSGADDAQIAVSKDAGGLIRTEIEWLKDGLPARPFFSRLEDVEIGACGEGRAGTSCVVVSADAAAASAGTSAGIPVTANQRRFLDILADAADNAPAEHKTTINIPAGRIAISREWLKSCCVANGWIEADGGNKARAKISEMINTLAGKRLVGTTAVHVWDAR